MLLKRTRAICHDFIEGANRIILVTSIVAQAVFLGYYGYLIYQNVDHLFYLIGYSVMAGLSLAAFIVYLVSQGNKRKEKFKDARLYLKLASYLVHGVTLVFSTIELTQYGRSDLKILLLAISFLTLSLQIILHLVFAYLRKYARLFSKAIRLDTNADKIAGAKTFKGGLAGFVDLAATKIASKYEAPEAPTDKDEIYLEERARVHSQRVAEKKEESEDTSEENIESLKRHWQVIKENLFKKKTDKKALPPPPEDE